MNTDNEGTVAKSDANKAASGVWNNAHIMEFLSTIPDDGDLDVEPDFSIPSMQEAAA